LTSQLSCKKVTPYWLICGIHSSYIWRFFFIRKEPFLYFLSSLICYLCMLFSYLS
jgi:hypothetical protein